MANRGEIALRVIYACKELGIKTVAVYSQADTHSLHVRFADEDVCIGPPQSDQSYLDPRRIISAAEVTNADAIHPGYGFLAENPDFAEICESSGISFIGPTSEMIRKMGDKAYAKEAMKKAGIPVIPGSDGVVGDLEEAVRVAKRIGFPVMIKARSGGGGKGMRAVGDEWELRRTFEVTRAEAKAAFGDHQVYVEKVIQHPRHVEVQVLGDGRGKVIHLGERECSIQRRHQKLVEESPSPAVTPKLREKMGKVAVKVAKVVKYKSAGTVEFLLDPDGNFYFMEMNTRIQVEHPVTEQVSGVDLVKEQIKIASGEALSIDQSELKLEGHAIECRINAEDPSDGFRPSPGEITGFHLPGGPGIRVDTHAYAQYVIPPYYDSILAKLIAHGRTRDEALRRMRRALEEFIVEGVKTTIPFHQKVLSDPDFVKGEFNTSFVERFNLEGTDVKV